jgi:prepilin-type processing-associated H-X9-DG protein
VEDCTAIKFGRIVANATVGDDCVGPSPAKDGATVISGGIVANAAFCDGRVAL